MKRYSIGLRTNRIPYAGMDNAGPDGIANNIVITRPFGKYDRSFREIHQIIYYDNRLQ